MRGDGKFDLLTRKREAIQGKGSARKPARPKLKHDRTNTT